MSRNTKYVLSAIASLVALFLVVTFVLFIQEMKTKPQMSVGEKIETLSEQGASQEQVVETLKEDLGLSAPLHVRYFRWLKSRISSAQSKSGV